MSFKPLNDSTQTTAKKTSFVPMGQTGQIQPQQPVQQRHGGGVGPIDFLAGAGTVLDALTAAPTRKALQTGIQEVKEGNILQAPAKAGLEGFKQFISFDPKQAPTGGEIARNDLGITTATEGTQPRTLPNLADIVGLGIDVGADVGNIIPFRMAPKAAAQTLKAITGKAPKFLEKLPSTSETLDFLTGSNLPTRISKGTKAGLDEFGNVLKRSFTSEPAPDFIKFQDIAIRNGIPVDDLPASVKFGKQSLKSRHERFQTQGPKGEQLFQNFENKTIQVNEAIRKDIQRVAGGQPIPNFEAGALIRDRFDESVNKLFDDISVTYDSAVPKGAFIEDDAFIKLDRELRQMQKRASRDADKGASDEIRSQGAQLFRNIEAIHAGNGSYKETLESMRDIGKAAFRSQNPAVVGPDTKDMQKLYFTLRDALTETVAHHNPTVADQLVSNNALISELLGDKNVLAKVVQNKNLADEQVFNQLILNGNSQKIQAMRTFFAGGDFQKIKGAFLNEVLKDDAITGRIGAKSTANLLDRKGNVAEFLFEEGEIQNFKDLLDLSDRLGTPILSSSETGGTIQFLKQAPLRGIESGLEAFLDPIKRAQEATVLPALRTPKAFIQGKGSKAKALQTLSTQREDSRREAVERANVLP